jgi:GT2 family glycosyltransferase
VVSIITVNFNQIDVTCALLDSIRRQDWRDLEVIVVDNGSQDNPEHILKTRYPEVIYLRSEENLGFAGGNNLGIAAAQGDYYFFVNNDTELIDGCIATLVQHCKKERNLGIASPLICYFPDPGRSYDLIQYAGMTTVHPVTGRNTTLGAQVPDTGQYSIAWPTAYAHGAAMMVPRQVVEKVGPMPAAFFLYYEELDWCEQMRRAGFSIWAVPSARIYHKESLTVSRMGALKTYYLHRNRILFMQRNRRAQLPLFYAWLWLIILPKSAFSYILKREWDNLRAMRQAVAWHFGRDINPYEQKAPNQKQQ